MTEGVVVTFGEVLLRLTAPRRERLLQTPALEACFGGAEANVAVALSRFGTPARLATVLPDNALGDAALDALRRHGVDVSPVVRSAGRLGLYFAVLGAGPRASDVTYDRAGSAFALAGADAIDWKDALRDAAWLHISGVTVAVSDSAERAARRAVEEASALGVRVSFDGNFRARLWQARGDDPQASLDWFLGHAHLAFVDHRDVSLLTGMPPITDEPATLRRKTTETLFERYPRLAYVANTTRDVVSHDHHHLSGNLALRDGQIVTSRRWSLTAIVDRIGGGDAFAGATLHALCEAMAPTQAIEFATAAGVLKHTLPGDMLQANSIDVEGLLAGQADVQR